jgi:hypothetical protein
MARGKSDIRELTRVATRDGIGRRGRAARTGLIALLGLTGAGLAHPVSAKQGPGDRWAAVSAIGTLGRNKGALSVNHSGNTYVVDFDRDVTGCIYLATPEPPTGIVTTVRSNTTPSAVFVSTYTREGADAERGFMLHVVCD